MRWWNTRRFNGDTDESEGSRFEYEHVEKSSLRLYHLDTKRSHVQGRREKCLKEIPFEFK